MTLDQLLQDLADLVHHRFADNVAPSTIERMFRDEIGDREPMELVPTRAVRAVVEIKRKRISCPEGKRGCLVAHYSKVCGHCEHRDCTCEMGELRKILEGQG